jgi:pimeloyl-ACP methyl ester carboxylesterase
MELKTIQTHRVPVRYYEGGAGQPLVFLHGAGGLNMDMAFLDILAGRFHVHAPLVPGYGDSEECAELREMLDFTLHTWDVVSALGLEDPILVGFSMGGMIASEMAAVAPNDVSRLALIAPAGLWMDEYPVPDFFAMLPYELPPVLFYDVDAGAKAMTAGVNMDDPAFLQAFLVQNARQLGTASKILFPIPERGLSQRLYRIKAKTQLIWGEGDKLIAPAYAREFQRRIRGSEVTMIREAAHAVTYEQPDALVAAISRLL